MTESVTAAGGAPQAPRPLPAEAQHRRIRWMGKLGWPLIGLFFLISLPWAGTKVLLCSGAVETLWVGNRIALRSMLAAALAVVAFGVVLYNLHSVGSMVEAAETAPPSAAGVPRRIARGMRGIRVGHRGHVRDSIRALL